MTGEVEIYLVVFMLFGGVIGFLINFIYRKFILPMRWPVKVLIAEKRGTTGYKWDEDRAARVRDKDGNEKYFLKKRKWPIPPPNYVNLHIGQRGETVLPLHSAQSNEYGPMNIENPPNLTVEDKELSFWASLESKRTHDIYPPKAGFLAKYGIIIAWGFLIGSLIFSLLFWAESGQSMSNAAASAASAAARAAEYAAQVAQYVRPPPIT